MSVILSNINVPSTGKIIGSGLVLRVPVLVVYTGSTAVATALDVHAGAIVIDGIATDETNVDPDAYVINVLLVYDPVEIPVPPCANEIIPVLDVT